MRIKRYFSDDYLERVKSDFKFLVKVFDSFHGEFDFAIRDDYFNIYYKGNSLARVHINKNGTYRVNADEKFIVGTKADNPKYYKMKTKVGSIILSKNNLYPFFQKEHLKEFASRIKKVNYGEEINFEQSLITDNINREDFIIIDRQVTDSRFDKRKLDLLALKKVTGNQFKFIVCEVKLGNNDELKDKVASQLSGYVKHIEKHFDDYKECYELNYEQKKELGFIKKPQYDEIDIVKPVEGLIVVGGYSGIAKVQIKSLRNNYPDLTIRQFTYKI